MVSHEVRGARNYPPGRCCHRTTCRRGIAPNVIGARRSDLSGVCHRPALSALTLNVFFGVAGTLLEQALRTLWTGDDDRPPRRCQASGMDLHARVEEKRTHPKARSAHLGVVPRKSPIDAFLAAKQRGRKAQRWNMTAGSNGPTQVLGVGELVDESVAQGSEGGDGDVHALADLRQRRWGDERVQEDVSEGFEHCGVPQNILSAMRREDVARRSKDRVGVYAARQEHREPGSRRCARKEAACGPSRLL